MRELHVIDRQGPEQFPATFDVQKNIVEGKIADRDSPDILLLVEHEPVYTVGRGVAFQQPAVEPARSTPWHEINRGGAATFHGPGQLVIYPIFDLERHGRDVHLFLRKLETALVIALTKFSVSGAAREGLTGVWVQTPGGRQAGDAGGGSADASWRKVASIGIGVKRWVSYHGAALNVDPELEYFRAISPCGQDGASTTSLAEICGRTPPMAEVKRAVVDAVCEVFELVEHRPGAGAPPEHESAGGSPQANGKQHSTALRRARPSWLRVKAPGSPQFKETLEVVREHKLVTVCEEARCPNIGECWTHHTATFMIMGELCTRRCSFCSVKDGTLSNLQPLDPLEPLRAAQAVQRLGLAHVVITSVNRDDLPDMGARHFDQTVRAIKHLNPQCDVEFLIPDMRGRRELVETVLSSKLLKILNHNIETVPSLYRRVRPGALFERSLNVLRWAKEVDPEVRTKSGLMVGLGEQRSEVLEVMQRLRKAGVEVLTIGQYLQPTASQLPVNRFVTPEEFADYRDEGRKLGFIHVESGPLVRSSYHAWQHTGDQ